MLSLTLGLCIRPCRTLTVSPSRYLFDLAQSIASTLPDVEVTAQCDRVGRETVVFNRHRDDGVEDDIELF